MSIDKFGVLPEIYTAALGNTNARIILPAFIRGTNMHICVFRE